MSVITKINGKASWVQQSGDTYLATGKDMSGKRFAIPCSTWQHCAGINLWRGNKWLIRDGKRHKIQSVFN